MDQSILTPQEKEWEELYGDLPESKEELIRIASTVRRVDWKKYEEEKNRIENMQWKSIAVSLSLIPKVTPRARWSSRNNVFYVKGAAENKKIIRHVLAYHQIISTAVKFCVDAYFPIPISQMKGYEILLAEEGYIRSLVTKDWDNIGKTYSDMIQNYLIINDNIIIDGRVRKFYSLRPHVDIRLEYQESYDSAYNQKRIENSKSYKNMIDRNKKIKMIK